MAEPKPGVAPVDWPTQLQWLHMHFYNVCVDLDHTVNPVQVEVYQDRIRVAWADGADLPTVVGLVFGELSRGHFPEVQPDV